MSFWSEAGDDFKDIFPVAAFANDPKGTWGHWKDKLGKLGFGGKANPQDDANQYLNQVPGILHNTYDPYIQQGQENYANLSNEYNAMGSDPTAYLQSLMKNYSSSKGYQFKQDQMQRTAGNTAAAGGMRGSINDIQNQAHLSNMLAGDDMQQWLGNVMGIKNEGLAGQQHFYDTGYDASKNMGGDLSNVFGSQAQLAFQNAMNKNKGFGDMLGLLGTVGGGIVGGYYGGGAGAVGGAGVGGAAGRGLGDYFGS